ncbi:MAG: glycosyl hydrolase family 18 protein [Lachnospiraceae bacterium]
MAQRKRKRKKNIFPALIAAAVILLAAILGAAFFLIKKYSPSDERMDLSLYFNLESEDDLAITVDHQIADGHGIVLDGRAYVSTEVVHDYLNSRFYWDSTENKYIYTLPMKMITAEVGCNEYYIDKEKVETDYQVLKVISDTAYVALDFVKQYTAMDYAFYEEPNRVSITCSFGEKEAARAKKSAAIRFRAGVKSPILTEVSKGDLLYILEEEEEIEKWTKVRTADGYIGYIQDKYVGKHEQIAETTEFEEPVYDNISKDYTINLVWHQVTNQKANDTIFTKLKDTKGITTISPTWFYIRDNSGNIESLASQSYVDYCHQNGVEVWALVENMTYAQEFDIVSVLSKTSSRQNLVTQLIAKAIQYGLDGINVDIEALPAEAGEGYIEFIRELSIMCRRNNVILSVDNYVPTAASSLYDRREQGIVADYVIIMGYDEHFRGSEKAGSVASIGYVEDGIVNTLKEVPAEKVINAVPFYTRLWCTAADGEVTSQVLGMNGADEILANNAIEKAWSEEAGQYYAEFENAEGLYQIWLEEERSVEEKAKLLKEYDLAGIASWKLGYERNDIWDVILKYVN